MKVKLSKLREILSAKDNDLTTDSGRSNERLRRIALAAIAAMINRAVTVLSSLLTVPITLKYLGTEQFGLWMTLTGFVAFLAFSDMGLGIGLQNSLTECHGKDDKKTPSQLITTTLVLLTVICVFICLFAWLGLPHLPLNDLIKVTSSEAIKNLLPTTQAVMIVFGLSLPLGIIQRILDAYQEGLLSNTLQAIGRILAFISIFVCIGLHYSLPIMAALYMGLPFLFLTVSSLFIFWKRPWLRPSIFSFKITLARKISGIGGYALLAQLGASIMSSGPLLMLSNQFGAEAIVPFAITQRLLGVVGMVLSLALAPLWPAFGEAKSRGDLEWIKLTFRRSIKITVWIAVPAFIAIALLGLPIIQLWTANEQTLPDWSLLMACNVWMLFLAFNRLYAMLLNGLGYFRGQAIYGVILPMLALLAGAYVSTNYNLTFATWSIVFAGEVARSLFMAIDAKRALIKLNNVDVKRKSNMQQKILLLILTPIGLVFGSIYHLMEIAKKGSKFIYLNVKYPNVKISWGANIIGNSTIEENITILKNTMIANSSVGKFTYFAESCIFQNCEIGRYCSIAPNVLAGLGRHPLAKNVSTSLAFYRASAVIKTYVKENLFNEEYLPISIGNDVWIGTRAIIMDGVTIGDGAVIAAGALVTKNVAPYAIVAGVPAKLLRKRYTQDSIDRLLILKWWERDELWIKRNIQLFNNIDKFIEYAE